jgi:hypothetical protein
VAQNRRRDVSNKETSGLNEGDYIMKKFIIAAAVLAASVTAAQAKCSKSAMNGEWLFAYESGGGIRVTFEDGNLTAGGALIGSYTMNSACKGTVILSGIPVIFTSRADKIEPDEDMKPGNLNFGFESGGSAVLWHMIRL